MWRRHPTELRADMQRVYGVDIDAVARGDVSFAQAAALAACLPPGSLCLAREDERYGWSRQDMLLLAIANSLRTEPIDPFKGPNVMEFSPEELGEYLARPRTAAENGGDA